MARILVTYFSRSGNTAQMAELIGQAAREVEGAEADVRPVEEVSPDDLLSYQGLILGSPVYYGGPAAEIKALLDASVRHHGKLDGRVGGAFASCGVFGGGCETTVLGLLQALLIHGMVVKGEYGGAHYGPVSVGAPQEQAAQACAKLGRSVATLAVRLFG